MNKGQETHNREYKFEKDRDLNRKNKTSDVSGT